MTKLTNSTKVKALDLKSYTQSLVTPTVSHDEQVLNPSLGRSCSDKRLQKGFLRPSLPFKLGTINCRTLNSGSSRAELNKHMTDFNISAACIQEHRYVHSASDSDIVAHNIGNSTLFTSSAARNEQGASVRGVGIAVKNTLLPLLISIKRINDRIVIAILKGNQKTFIVSCYSPHNTYP